MADRVSRLSTGASFFTLAAGFLYEMVPLAACLCVPQQRPRDQKLDSPGRLSFIFVVRCGPDGVMGR